MFKIRWYLVPLVPHPLEASRLVPHPDARVYGRVTTIALTGGWAICRVVADETEHTLIAASTNVRPFPRFGRPISDLPTARRTQLAQWASFVGSDTVETVLDRLIRRGAPQASRANLRRAYTQDGVLREESAMIED